MRLFLISIILLSFSLQMNSQDQVICWDWDVTLLADQQTYWENGDLKTENSTMESGLVRTSYFEGGGVWIEEEIKQSRTIDTVITYDPETYAETYEIVKNFCDYPNGGHVEYYPNGSLKAKGEYLENRLVGEWIEYYPNGSVKTKGEYKENRRFGAWNEYYPNGNSWKVLNYGEEENLKGAYLEYHENGLIKVDGMYGIEITYQKVITFDPETYKEHEHIAERRKSVKSGIWRFYSEEGELLEEVNYN